MDQIANPSPGFQRNPGKIITVEPYAGTVTVRAGGEVIASSRNAKMLREDPYPAAFYIPFEDIDFGKLAPSEKSSHCPYKGDASYWSVPSAGDTGKDAMWAYPTPYDEMADIRDHGAFYRDRVNIEAVPG